jgi:hypothetical protein
MRLPHPGTLGKDEKVKRWLGLGLTGVYIFHNFPVMVMMVTKENHETSSF